jgi:hypothetical protein
LCLAVLALNCINLERRAISAQTVTVREFDPEKNIVRRLDVAFKPNAADPEEVAVVGSGLSAKNVGEGKYTANLDVAGFHMRTPGVNGNVQDFSLYFGYLDADANYNAKTGMGSIQASLAEVVAAFYSIFVWENRNGEPGFQYTLNNNHFGGCRDGETIDCFRTVADGDEFQYNLKTAQWNPIEITQYNCSDDANAVEGTPCTVTTFTASTADGVATFDMHIASQPVLIGNIELDPNHAKLDVSINWDWSVYNGSCAQCSLALVGATAGKLTNGNLDVQHSEGSTTRTATFSTGDYEASFEWEESAAVQGTATTVYYSAISRSALEAWTCGGDVPCLSVGGIINGLWKIAVGVFKGFGWETTVLVFSWDAVQPENVFWDPSVGGGPVDGYDFSTSGSSTLVLTNLIVFVLAYLL